MNRDSNVYTFTFATLMVFVVASVLAYTSFSLKDLQNENVRKEKMQNILSTVGIQTDREGAEKLFNQYVKEQLAIQSDGSIDNSVNVFKDVKLALELKKSPETQDFPLYVAEIDSEKFYIIPIRGNGLWNAIFGYISLKEDLNTIKGSGSSKLSGFCLTTRSSTVFTRARSSLYATLTSKSSLLIGKRVTLVTSLLITF